MSDLSMYELEDIIWDDFERGDDHIVPHHTNAHTGRNSIEGDSCKKPRREANADNFDASNSIYQEKGEFKPLDKKENMMEKETLPHTPPDVFNASIDGEIVKDMPNLASDDTRFSNNCFKSSYGTSGSEFQVDDCVLSGTSAAGDGSSYSYPVTHISQTEDLCFVDNDCEDKGSSDLLYYGWPDMGNLEDVDKMLRSCDSSLGLGVIDNDDELGWFTSDQLGCTEEALKMDFKFPCPEPCAIKNMSQDHDSTETNNHRSSCISEGKDDLNFKDQVSLQQEQSKHQNQTEGKKTGQYLGNDDSFYHISDFKSNDSRLCLTDKSDRVFTSVGHRQQYRNSELDCFGHMQSNTYPHPDYGHAPYHTTAGPMPPVFKSELKGLKSRSPKESSYASNQGHSMECSGDPSFQGERTQAYNSQESQPLFIGNPKQMGMMFQAPKNDLVSAQKQAQLSSAKELERGSDVEGVQKGVWAEIGSLNVPESSSVNSELDEISLEATSFSQLQQVMEQLDLRTKLCIRDSLYRLARSAEQRHNNPSLSAGVNDIGGPLMAERTNKCTGFMDMETDTNPIDRSVAHLLFHRPSDSPNLPAPSPLKPHAIVHGSITGPSVIAEKQVCQEEAPAESMDS